MELKRAYRAQISPLNYSLFQFVFPFPLRCYYSFHPRPLISTAHYLIFCIIFHIGFRNPALLPSTLIQPAHLALPWQTRIIDRTIYTVQSQQSEDLHDEVVWRESAVFDLLGITWRVSSVMQSPTGMFKGWSVYTQVRVCKTYTMSQTINWCPLNVVNTYIVILQGQTNTGSSQKLW